MTRRFIYPVYSHADQDRIDLLGKKPCHAVVKESREMAERGWILMTPWGLLTFEARSAITTLAGGGGR